MLPFPEHVTCTSFVQNSHLKKKIKIIANDQVNPTSKTETITHNLLTKKNYTLSYCNNIKLFVFA